MNYPLIYKPRRIVIKPARKATQEITKKVSNNQSEDESIEIQSSFFQRFSTHA